MSIRFRLLLSLLLWAGNLLLQADAAQADAYAFTTLAGGRVANYRDGPAGVAQFGSAEGLAFDASGFLYVADTNNLCIRKIAPDGTVSTFAGDPRSRQIPVDGPLAVARFSGPIALTFDQAGNMFVADRGAVRRITPAGIVSTLGSDIQPQGIAISPSGEIYIAEGGFGSIRKVGLDGTVSNFAGVYREPGNADGVGTAARFGFAADIVFDRAGNLFVADSNNNAIRRVTPAGVVTTLATLEGVRGLAFDPEGNLLATSSYYPVVWKIVGTRPVALTGGVAALPDGNVTNPLIGHVDGPAGVGQMGRPSRLAVDTRGVMYVSADCIRRVGLDGALTTFAGVARPVSGVDGIGAEARFVSIDAVAADSAGNVYVSDATAHVIRKITPAGVVTTLAGVPGRAGYRDGDGRSALFMGPGAISAAPDGAVYVMDSGFIRRVSGNGDVTTHIGAYASRPAFRFYPGNGVFTVDAAGNVYVFDSDQCVVRKITPAGEVSLVAGSPGQSGFVDGPATQARFSRFGSGGIAVGRDGSLYVSDTMNSAVRKISASGIVTTLVAEQPEYPGQGFIGTPPGGVALEPSGAVLAVFDRTFRRITAEGTVRDVPGSPIPLGDTYDGYVTTSGSGGFLRGLVARADGTVYIADPWNGTILRGEPRPASRLSNLSIRAVAASGEQALIAGFALRGDGASRMLLRGIGPGLAPFGVSDAMTDPQVMLFDAAGASRGQNDDWGGSETLAAMFRSAGAFALPAASRDAALVAELPAGTFSAHLGSTARGSALMEVYSQGGPTSAQLVNLSCRTEFNAATGSVSAGFSISGEATKTVLIRGLGPVLRFFGLVHMGNTRLQLFDATGRLLAENDGWGGVKRFADAFARVGAFPLQPADRDSALILQLSPGTYSVQLSNPSGKPGSGMIEIYDADP